MLIVSLALCLKIDLECLSIIYGIKQEHNRNSKQLKILLITRILGDLPTITSLYPYEIDYIIKKATTYKDWYHIEDYFPSGVQLQIKKWFQGTAYLG